MTTTIKKLTKAERKQLQLNNHYKALENIAAICGINADGKKLSLKLWKLETEARKLTIANNNGEGNTTKNSLRLDEIKTEVLNLFSNKLTGFELNTDGRGKALKINDDFMRKVYVNTGLSEDWVRNGILSPDIDGTE